MHRAAAIRIITLELAQQSGTLGASHEKEADAECQEAKTPSEKPVSEGGQEEEGVMTPETEIAAEEEGEERSGGEQTVGALPTIIPADGGIKFANINWTA